MVFAHKLFATFFCITAQGDVEVREGNVAPSRFDRK